MSKRKQTEEELKLLSSQLPPLSDFLFKKMFYPITSTNDEHFMNSRRKREGRYYYSIVTTKGGWQVIRKYLCFYSVKRNGDNYYDAKEVMQTWINKDKEQYVFSKKVCGPTCYYDLYSYDSELTYKGNESYYCRSKGGESRMYVEGDVFVVSVQPWLAKYGYSKKFKSASNIIPELLKGNSYAEFLAKTAGSQFADDYAYHKRHCNRNKVKKYEELAYAFKIMSRRKYVVKDVMMWFDMFEALEYLGKDTHNPQYICPDNFAAAHDKWIDKRSEKEFEAEMPTVYKKFNGQYLKDKRPYLHIVFGNANIKVHVLQDIKEFFFEGKAMHHCVYKNGYYKKPDMLILSATDRNGQRLETVRIDLNTFRIVESRGICNDNSYAHSDIVNLVNKNMHLFKKAS